MPPKPLVDLSAVDLSQVVAGPDQIRRFNPQRDEMEHLDGVILLDVQAGIIIGFKDAREDEFWVRGHIPGRPLLPGVLMCEAAAQLCSYYYKCAIQMARFLGFGGMEGVKFRGEVVPGDRLILVAKCTDLRPRRASFDCQGFVRDRMVFEGSIIGMPM
jgi:3-hydroxyacyl-[acyl-carrier-protein] dehydratase